MHEPRRRLISAASYGDRVVHHALTQVLAPVFERRFISDSYACRVGRGTHAAVRRAQHFSRRFPWVLKADIRKFFPSMDHQILVDLVARTIKDPHVLALVELLVRHSNRQEPVLDWFPGDDLLTPGERARGLPIGNQTSWKQHIRCCQCQQRGDLQRLRPVSLKFRRRSKHELSLLTGEASDRAGSP
ncbi:MAG: reverse transcriptase domain-containing protein [Planctomycetaceae bacterium]